MILVDTNVLVRYCRLPSPDLEARLSADDVRLCDLVRAELMHGARDAADLIRLEKFLDTFVTLEASPALLNF